MTLEIATVKAILKEHNLLVSVDEAQATSFSGIQYDSRKVTDGDMFFCKGNFKPAYLISAKNSGATAYVAEQKYDEGTGMTAVIVSNVTRALAVLSAAYYDFPQDKLFIIAITGTKGKTSTAYFAHSILKNHTEGKTALFSTIDRIVGPEPEDEFKSDLTTPESLDLFHDMRTAVDKGMKTLVMEVSSQAYLRDRVYGLKFDVGVFLNITPDHIGRNEHRDFEDYLHCKLQLMVNSKYCVINAETDRFEDVYMTAKATSQPERIFTYAREGATLSSDVRTDFTFKNDQDRLDDMEISVQANSYRAKALDIAGDFKVNVPGDYNQSNATAALITAGLAGAKASDAIEPLSKIVIPGRMEHLDVPNHGMVFVDYAHNYASMKALLRFLHGQYPDGKVIVVVGSPGDKGISRRAGFGKALSAHADLAYLTTDDPGFEDPNAINDEIEQSITPNTVQVKRILDRREAIATAIKDSKEGDVVVLAAKGDDHYQKVRGVDTPWPSDMVVANEVKRGLE